MRRALARVDLGAIERNCARLAATVAPADLCAVVKADGYGHGAAQAARAAQVGGARWLAVATAGEAEALRAAGLDGPLLVMGALTEAELDVALAAEADVVAWEEDFVAAVAARGRGAVHVKLDTGMGRLGTRDAAQADGVAAAVAAAGGLRLAGAMTHFATADDDDAFVQEQLAAFRPWAAALADRHPGLLVHAANSAAALRQPGARFGMVRCGIAIYGMDPFHRDPADHGLEPALELVSYVAAVQARRAGTERGLRAPLRGRARDVDRHHPDRVRRRRAPRADQQRGRARRRASRCRSSGRSRWTTSPSTWGTSRSRPARRRS